MFLEPLHYSTATQPKYCDIFYSNQFVKNYLQCQQTPLKRTQMLIKTGQAFKRRHAQIHFTTELENMLRWFNQKFNWSIDLYKIKEFFKNSMGKVKTPTKQEKSKILSLIPSTPPTKKYSNQHQPITNRKLLTSS